MTPISGPTREHVPGTPPGDPRPAAPRGQGGRPPASRAGEVDARILDAARALFLSRGFDGTSCDQVAAQARAGKASIYARHPSKEALLAAVLRRDAARGMADLPPPPPGVPVGERLAAVGIGLVERALRPDAVALLRLVVAEAGRLPALAPRLGAAWRDGAVGQAAAAIAGPSASPEAVARAAPPAALFVEAALAPIQMRALLGDDLAALGAGAAARVEAAVALLAATGRLDGWP